MVIPRLFAFLSLLPDMKTVTAWSASAGAANPLVQLSFKHLVGHVSEDWIVPFGKKDRLLAL